MRVIVIGGGVIGTTTAYYLGADGHEVVLVEREPQPASEASYANGGMLHASHTEPWNTPAAVGQLIRWIGREQSPLLLRPSQIPHLMGWGMNFFRYSMPRHHLRSTRVNARLAVYSIEMMQALRSATGIRYDDVASGIVKIFHDEAELANAEKASRLVEDLGVRYEMLDTAQLVAREPVFQDIREQLVGGLYYPRDEIGDTCLFTRRLAEMAVANGLELRLGETVDSLESNGGRITGVHTDRETLRGDAYVLAAGVDAPRLAQPVGIKLPIRPVKGYSGTVNVRGCDGVPRLPIIDEARKVVMSVLGDRLRVAGTAEFAGFDRSVNRRRVQIVLQQALASLPRLGRQVDPDAVDAWACLRPMTVDGPPILGETPLSNLYLNAGPGHLGWTFAAGAARAVADVVQGNSPAIDLTGLTYHRFH